jgi:hypothetical protein
MRWRAALLAACIAPASWAGGAEGVPVRCQDGEQALFACSAGRKQVAVCASRDFSASTGYVQYRYGKPDRAELVLPRAPQAPASSASSGALAFSGGGGGWLRFNAGDTEYVVFSAVSSSWGEKSGVVVERGGKRLRAIACSGPVTSHLDGTLFRKAGFAADTKDFDLPD